MLPIQGATTVREISSLSESFLNCLPIILSWGCHVFNKCFPQNLTYLWYDQADSTGWQMKTASQCLIGVSRCKKSAICKEREEIIDCVAWGVLFVLGIALICHSVPHGQFGRMFSPVSATIFRWFKFTLKPPYTVAIGNLILAIWDTSHWNFFVKFGLKTA